MDQLRIKDLEVYAYHGVFAAEKELGQRFVLDLILDYDMTRAAKTGDLTASIPVSYTHLVTQLSLAELHGNLSLALLKIEEYLDNLAKVKKKLIEVATYPMMLLGFLVLIMMGLRNYLLPQLSSQNFATQLIGHLPTIFLLSVLMLLGLTGAI